MIIAAKLEHWDTAARLLGFVDRLRSDQNVSPPARHAAVDIDADRAASHR